MTGEISGLRLALTSGAVKYLLIVCAVVGAVTLYLLATASANTALFAQHYPLLLALNGGLAVCLAFLLGYQLYALRQKLKAGVFGAKLTLRLVLLFALVAVLPGALVYGVSVQFVARSIESWFDVRVEKALEGGLNLGRTTLDNLLKDLIKKADAMAASLAVRPPAEHIAALNTLREQAGAQEATLFTPRGKVLVFSGSERTGLMPDVPGPNVMRQLRQQQVYSAIEAIPDRGLYLRVLIPVNTISLADDMRVLQLLQRVPRQLALDAEIVQTGQREYQELLLARQGLKRLYGITLTLTLLLALLTALSLAFVLSERLSAPLSFLVEGTRAVAQGDFSQRETVASSDELGVLTQSFNAMRQQLAEARATAELNQEQLTEAHTYVQSILANLSAGVLAFDESLRLRSFNHSASAILDVDFAQLSGLELAHWHERVPALQQLAGDVDAAFRAGAGNEWTKQIERAGKGGNQMLLLRGTRLPAGSGTGYVVVFDDITHVLQAQRDAAWTEVARRLAHEIRNPLTPIQLSAERLQHKLADKLGAVDADMLKRSTQTIVNQVSALKNMVEAFRQYARMPEPTRQELDFNELVREVLMLYESLAGRLTVELAPNLPRIVGDPAQLRQVIHNLLQNAEDALADAANPRIVLRTEPLAGGMWMTISDNGSGFPHELMQRVFEPYVTTKPKGTGLGLVIVKKIIEEHGGSVEISNIEPHGARVTLTFPAMAVQTAAIKAAARA
ncbi:MAG: HAMP domain-containing protein [Betaproteobacteria bacterium]|nr:HAMP domain-containing protein [Betaproteobacteria bacterium]